MIPIVAKQTKLIAFDLSSTDDRNGYPVRRALRIAEELAAEADSVFITDGALPLPDAYQRVQSSTHRDLLSTLAFLKPDVLIRDCGNTAPEETEAVRALVPAVLHFDDFGAGGQAADFVIQTLYGESESGVMDSYRTGIGTFLKDPRADSLRKQRGQRTAGDPPRLLIAFGESDPGNLTFRAFRHVLNVQIPLHVTILLGPSYAHDAGSLRMMALSRRNTVIKQGPEDFLGLAADADIVLCGGGYMPYEAASIGVPCIVLAQSPFESELRFPSEEDGFTHLGLGRKVKQSNLLNAIMEPLLHESLRKRDVGRQLALPLGKEADSVFEAVRYLLEHPKRSIAGRPVPDVIN